MKKFSLSPKKNRIWELDFLRGFAIIMVFFDHAFYDYARIFSSWKDSGVQFLEWLNSLANSYLLSDVRAEWRPAFLFVFFCVSGLCTAFSKNNLLRGLRLFCAAMILSAITYLGEELLGVNCFILFGVIHCLGAIILIYSVYSTVIRLITNGIQKLVKKQVNTNLTEWVLCVACLLASVACFVINHYFNPPYIDVNLKGTLGEDTTIMTGMFFYARNWVSADYFPIFPYIAFFFLGAGLTKIIYPKKKTLLPKLDTEWHNVFSFAGRHSLFVYFSGQVVALLLGVILSLICLGRIF